MSRRLTRRELVTAVGAGSLSTWGATGTAGATADPTSRAAAESVDGPWPMFHGGAENRGWGRGLEGPGESATEAWRLSSDYNSVTAAPAAVGATLYAVSAVGELHALDPATGESYWTAGAGIAQRAPAVAYGMVYVATGHEIQARRADDGTEVWAYELDGRTYAPPVVTGRTVFAADRSGNLHALDPLDGERRWTASLGRDVWSAPAATDEVVYVGDMDGHVYAVNAGDGTEVWSVDTGAPVRTGPTVVDGTVYTGNWDGTVYALDAETGETEWTSDVTASVSLSAAVDDDTVYVGAGGSVAPAVYALDAATGEQRWTFEGDESFYSSPTVADGVVYVGSRDQSLYALDADDGTVRWTFEANGRVSGVPTVAYGAVYVGSHDGNLYAIGSPEVPERYQFTPAPPPEGAGETPRETTGAERGPAVREPRQDWLDGWRVPLGWLATVSLVGPLVLGALVAAAAWFEEGDGEGETDGS